jgi:hypothetical protein
MIALVMLATPHGTPPPPWFLLVLVPLVFSGATLFSSWLLGIFDLYKAFPADISDPIETKLGWIQIEFGTWRGHAPISTKAGRRCLHLKEPFPFQPFFWLGPASISWDQIQVTKAGDTRWWSFWSATEFTLGTYPRPIKIRGKAGRKVQAQVDKHRGPAGGALAPSIRPR